jgi:hypothetical protein
VAEAAGKDARWPYGRDGCAKAKARLKTFLQFRSAF